MLTPIHRALGRVPSPVTWDLLEDAVSDQVQEGTNLDWKQSVYNHRTPKWQDEAAKDIAAMANSGGGWIVFGIAEDRQTSAAAEITGVTWGQGDEQRLLRVAYTRIGPPLLGLEFTVVPDPAGDDPRSVVLMRVPDSSERPHLASKEGDGFIAPVRNGQHTAFMDDREIERAFRERFAMRAEREESLQSLYEETAEQVDPATAVGFVFVAVPVEPRHDPVQMHDQPLYAMFAQTQPGKFYDRQGQVGSSWGFFSNVGDVRRGRRRWTTRGREPNMPSFRAIHEDGTVQTALRLGGLRQDDAAAPYYPVGLPNHCMSVHIEHALAEGLALLEKWAAHLDVQGGYSVRVGLVGQPGEPIYIRTTQNSTNYLLDADHSEPIHRFHPVTVELDPLNPIDDLQSLVAEIALDLINQGGVRYLKAIHEPQQAP